MFSLYHVSMLRVASMNGLNMYPTTTLPAERCTRLKLVVDHHQGPVPNVFLCGFTTEGTGTEAGVIETATTTK